MNNSSEDLQSLSSSLSKKELKTIYKKIVWLVESDLEISVEKIYGDNSYWVPTPDFEIEELELFGVIEIGDDQTIFEKIISLAHEVGHCILHKEKTFNQINCVLFTEAVAWYLGFLYFQGLGFKIDLNEYQEATAQALDLYRRSLNERDVK